MKEKSSGEYLRILRFYFVNITRSYGVILINTIQILYWMMVYLIRILKYMDKTYSLAVRITDKKNSFGDYFSEV